MRLKTQRRPLLKPITSGVKASLSGDGHRASRDVFSHCFRLITKLSYLTGDFFLLAKLKRTNISQVHPPKKKANEMKTKSTKQPLVPNVTG